MGSQAEDRDNDIPTVAESRLRKRLSRSVIRRQNRRLIERAAGIGRDTTEREEQFVAVGSRDAYSRLWRTVFTHGVEIGVTVGLLTAAMALIGRLIGSGALGGGLFGGRPASATSAVLMGLLGLAILCLRPDPVPRLLRRAADLLAGLACVLTVAVLLAQALGSGWFAPAGTGLVSGPSAASMGLCLLLGTGLLVLDRDLPRQRVTNVLVAVIGLVLAASLLNRGYRIQLAAGDVPADLTLVGLAGICGLAFAYTALRPGRGVAGFMVSSGPGPAMARMMAPVIVAVPLVMVFGPGADGLDPVSIAGLQRIAELIVVVALAAVAVFASRRLQTYYEEWRQAAADLSEQAGVFSAMAEGVAVMRIADNRLVLTNPQFDRMHGYPPGALVGELVERVMPDDPTAAELVRQEKIGQDLIDHGAAQFDTRALRRDGSVIWCRTNSILSEDPQHGPVLIMVKSDITAEYEAKAAGAAAQASFRQVFEQSPIGLALVRHDGSFDRVNGTFADLTGYRQDELLGMTFAEITHPDDLEEDLEKTAAMFRGEAEGLEIEKRYIRKDGGIVRVHLSAVMLRNADGEATVALSMVQDVTERHELSRRLQYLADHDPLTGLYNRRRFEVELERAMSGPDGGVGPGLAVMMIDLDNFKFINDNYGHAIGDQLIVRTGEVLQQRLRHGDVLARQGGDEFVLLLRDVEPQDALSLAIGLVSEISTEARVEGSGFLARATASIGVATRSVTGPGDPEHLIREADIAMYEVKDSGRNGARVYNASAMTNMSQGIDWHDRIRSALDREGFRLFCQPLLSLKGDPVPQFELFLRLPGQDDRPIGPGAFLPVAERHNLIGDVDRWVVTRVIRLLGRCRPDRAPRLFVNLSGQSVGDMDLLGLIAEELARNGVDPDRIVFEFTETSAIANIDRARRFAAELAGIGCHTALDDFGAGFASFYYLKHISTDYVKIDGEFIRNLAEDRTSQLLVRALSELCLGLGKKVVAEQVEDRQALRLLEEYGVDLVQGYLFGRPVPASPGNLAATGNELHRVR